MVNEASPGNYPTSDLPNLHGPDGFGLEMKAPDDPENSGLLIQAMIDPKGGTGRRVLRLRGLLVKMARGERIN